MAARLSPWCILPGKTGLVEALAGSTAKGSVHERSSRARAEKQSCFQIIAGKQRLSYSLFSKHIP
jgi:hypothetical protein